jgi:hypothetical protein
MPITFNKAQIKEAGCRISEVFEISYPYRNSKLKPVSQERLLKFAMPTLDLDALVKSTYGAMEKYGSWDYRIGMQDDQVKRDSGYGGIGLTYNPDHLDLANSDIHEQVQGNPNPARGMKNPFTKLNPLQNFLYAIPNSHYDTYSFCYRTPASRFEYLGKFLDSCKRTMVRSAVRIIYADRDGQVGDDKLAGVRWHRDEAMFENLRVNIPLVTDPVFVLEQQDCPPEHLEAGYAYSWDTDLLHCAYAKERVPKHRIHLMLGFSCWWDFDEETGSWAQNEFFGKKHPKDMLVDGDVIPGLELT